MELKKYIYPLRRWWWLLVAATLVAAVSSFIVTLGQPKVYQATTTIMIGRTIADPNPTASEVYLSQQLAGTYADIANRDVVRNATMTALKLDWLPSYRAQALPNSQLIEISVVDTLPQRAQIVANELAKQLIAQSPTSSRPEDQNRQDFVNQQLDTLQAQMKQTSEDIAKLQDQLGNTVSARQLSDIQGQINALQTKYTTLQSNYGTLLSNTQRGAINTMSVIEPAGLPRSPIGPAKLTSILVAALIGLALAAGAAYVLEYLDDSLKTPDDIREIVGLPVIGYISDVYQDNSDLPYVTAHPRHPIAESFRTLRTNLEFSAVDQPFKTILVSSAEAGEGKTFVTVNLAASLAQDDKKVIIVDSDLRKPQVHELLGMHNDFGLSDFFRGRSLLPSVTRVWRKDEKVAVITGGTPPPNPTELLGSQKMDQILASLEDVANVVILDGPPFEVADAAVLAAKVDGVVLIIRPGYSRKASVKAMMEQLDHSGARLVGVVVNQIPRKLADYYGGQLHLSPYYYGYGDSSTQKEANNRAGLNPRAAISSALQSLKNTSHRDSPESQNTVRPVETSKRSND